MSSQTNEHTFETQVERTLLGASRWQSGANAEWNVERALFAWRLSWLTPLAADAGFRPETAALAAAAPYLDDLEDRAAQLRNSQLA